MDKLWNMSFVFSLMIHFAALAAFSPFTGRVPILKEKPMEIEIVPDKIEKITGKVNSKGPAIPPPPYIENIAEKIFTENKKVTLEKDSITKENIKNITLAETAGDKKLEKIPAYADYYRLIRERIRKNAFKYYNIKDQGEVFISFIILDTGYVEDIYINEDIKGIKHLIAVAVKSVKDAAPFPSFTKELQNYKKLQFNISIQFRSENKF